MGGFVNFWLFLLPQRTIFKQIQISPKKFLFSFHHLHLFYYGIASSEPRKNILHKKFLTTPITILKIKKLFFWHNVANLHIYCALLEMQKENWKPVNYFISRQKYADSGRFEISVSTTQIACGHNNSGTE